MPDDDFSRRTLLANERTYLAWWRTGLVCMTVALGTARVVPELAEPATQWPYTVLGVAFGVLGVFCVAYGDHRRRAVVAALKRGDYAEAGNGRAGAHRGRNRAGTGADAGPAAGFLTPCNPP